jgi:hypothetical protein
VSKREQARERVSKRESKQERARRESEGVRRVRVRERAGGRGREIYENKYEINMKI